MNDTITTREELLLAKIAGRDVNIDTMTPPVASNLSEKLMLEIAERLDNMGGDVPTYETVAEIAVSAEHKAEIPGIPEWCHLYVVPDCESQALAIDEADAHNITMYFNDASYPLCLDRESGGMFFHNMTIVDELPARVEEDAPAFGIGFREDSSISAQIASSEDLSDTTIKILKKVEQGGTTGDKLVVHLTESDVDGEPVYTADKSVAEIIAADAAGQVVECEYEDRRYGLFSVVKEEDGKACNFALAHPSDAHSIFAGVIAGESADGADTWVYQDTEVETPSSNLKPTYEFGFNLTHAAGDGFYCTPESGVALADIISARNKTPNVYAVCTLADDGLKITLPFNIDYNGTNVIANTIFLYSVNGQNVFCGARLSWGDGGTPAVIVRPLE